MQGGSMVGSLLRMLNGLTPEQRLAVLEDAKREIETIVHGGFHFTVSHTGSSREYTRDLALGVLGLHAMCRRFVACGLVTHAELLHSMRAAPMYTVANDMAAWGQGRPLSVPEDPAALLRRNFDLLDDILTTGRGHLVVAGGAPSAALTSSYQWRHMDVDLFFVGLTADQVTTPTPSICVPEVQPVDMGSSVEAESIVAEVVARMRDRVSAQPDAELNICRTPHSITLSVITPYAMRKYQIILRLYPSIASVLLGFDLDCCRVAFLPNGLFTATATGAIALVTAIVPADTSCVSPSWVLRMAKYVRRGWRFVFPHADWNRLALDHPSFHAYFLCKPWSSLHHSSFRAFFGIAASAPVATGKAFDDACSSGSEAVEAEGDGQACLRHDPYQESCAVSRSNTDYTACASDMGAQRCFLRQLLRDRVNFVPIIHTDATHDPVGRFVSLEQILHPYGIPPHVARPGDPVSPDTGSKVTWPHAAFHGISRLVRFRFALRSKDMFSWLPRGFPMRDLLHVPYAEVPARVRDVVLQVRRTLRERYVRVLHSVEPPRPPSLSFLVRNPGRQHTSSFQLQPATPRDIHGRYALRGTIGVQDGPTIRILMILHRVFRRHDIPADVRRWIMFLIGEHWVRGRLQEALGMPTRK